MPLNLIPDNAEVIELVRRHVHGPYRFVHDAMKPYVRVWPATEDESITFTPGPHFCLPQNKPETLKGMDQTRDFAVFFERGHVTLRAIGMFPTRQPVAKMLLDNMEQAQTSINTKPVLPLTMERLQRNVETLRAADPLNEILQREDVHPEHGDYLVIPQGSVYAHDTLPSWVVKSRHIQDIYVVKPRLGVDKPIGQRSYT